MLLLRRRTGGAASLQLLQQPTVGHGNASRAGTEGNSQVARCYRAATLLPVSKAITQRAIDLSESLTLSHGLQMGDALIAATAIEHQLPVLTANVSTFRLSRR